MEGAWGQISLCRCRRKLFRALACLSAIALLLFVVAFPIKKKLTNLQGLTLNNVPRKMQWNSEAVDKHSSKESTRLVPRRNVIILTHMSSGSTFLGNFFNFHPSVFYLYEPLNALRTQRYKDEWHALEEQENEVYKREFSELMLDLFGCGFQDEDTLRLILPMFLRKSKEFASWITLGTGSTRNPAAVRAICKNRQTTVAKIMQTRLPENVGIQQLRRVCRSNPEAFDCAIIHLVRDPRAVVSSLLRRTFFYGGATKEWFNSLTSRARDEVIKDSARRMCSQVQDNIKFVKETPDWFNGRYKLIRYEDVLRNITSTVDDLYAFVGLVMVDEISKWIREGVTPVKSRKPSFSMLRFSEQQMQRWRLDCSPAVVTLVEEVCKPLMELMGYVGVDGSERTQRDVTKSLVAADIPVLRKEPTEA